jgi:hypothetical protein
MLTCRAVQAMLHITAAVVRLLLAAASRPSSWAQAARACAGRCSALCLVLAAFRCFWCCACASTGRAGRCRVTAPLYPTKTARPRGQRTSCARPDEVSAPADAQERRSACAKQLRRRVWRRSGPPLLRYAPPARPQRAARLHWMQGAPSSSRVQRIAAAAPPGDRTKRCVAVAKCVSTRHTSKYARRHPAQTKCTHRPCALRVLHRPSSRARATNMEPARRARAQGAHTSRRRQHSARRGKSRLRTLLRRHQERACGSALLQSRGLGLRGTPVCGGAGRGAPSCSAPFALKLRHPTCHGPHSSASAPAGLWQCQRRTFCVAPADFLLRSRSALISGAVCSGSAARHTDTSSGRAQRAAAGAWRPCERRSARRNANPRRITPRAHALRRSVRAAASPVAASCTVLGRSRESWGVGAETARAVAENTFLWTDYVPLPRHEQGPNQV